MKQHAPATERNRNAILEVLREELAEAASVLEIGSGSGQHAVFFAARLPGLTWQPSDAEMTALNSIRAWRDEAALANLNAPVRLDTRDPTSWPDTQVDGVFSANLIHIAPWPTCEGLMRVAGRLVRPGGRLLLYGPFNVDGAFTSPSNARFDDWLKARDSRFGIRDRAEVGAEAALHGLELKRSISMPANNFILVFERQTRSG